MPASPVDASEMVEIGPKLRRRFYEPIVLLGSLGKACLGQEPFESTWKSDLTSYPPHDSGNRDASERALHLFINKLAYACDSAPGGSAVTAFAILNEPDKVEYVFASNERRPAEVDEARTFVECLLKTVRDGPSTADVKKREFHRTVMRMILAFHVNRLSYYARRLSLSLQECLASCEEENSDESRSLTTALAPLLGSASAVQGEKQGTDRFLKRIESLVNLIDNIFRGGKSAIVSLISTRVKMRIWAESIHHAGRLGSYVQAAWTIVYARDQWPALFDSFEVIGIPSSTPIRNPLKCSTNAHDIIGRMTSNVDEQNTHRAHAEFMQRFGLDDNIQRVCNDNNFKPRVHCEVLLHDWLERRPGGIRPNIFFSNSKYIGASKPTCRLCARYFTHVKSGVRVRDSHNNLYYNWRMPDVFKSQGQAATKERERIMNAMTGNVRRDVFQMMVEKIPIYNARDSVTWSDNVSNTHPGSILGSGGTGSHRQASGAPSMAASAGIDEIMAATRSLKLVNDMTGETMEIQPGWRIQSSQNSLDSSSFIGVQDSVSQAGEIGDQDTIGGGTPDNNIKKGQYEDDDDEGDVGGGARL